MCRVLDKICVLAHGTCLAQRDCAFGLVRRRCTQWHRGTMMSKTPIEVAAPQRVDAEATAPHDGQRPVKRTLLGRLSRRLSAMPLRIQLWNGKVLQPSDNGDNVSIRITSLPALLRVLANPGFHLGEG